MHLSSEEVVRLVERRPGLKTRQLARELGVAAEELVDFASICLGLQRDGSILRLPQDGWDIPERTDYRVGWLSMDRRGRGFVRVARETIHEADIFVEREDVAEAFPGDLVLVRLRARPRRGRKGGAGSRGGGLREGEIVDVVERSRRLIRGKYFATRRGGIVKPDDRRLSEAIVVGAEDTGGCRDGEEVLVCVTGTIASGGRPAGRVVSRRQEEGTFRNDLRVIRELYELPDRHPAEALREAESLEEFRPSAGARGRVDLRDRQVFTIDPPDAKDFDDAVSLDPLDGHEVCLEVHIADVSYYVKPGSALDREAERRGTSIYLPGHVIPMFPERLCNGLCSLRAGEDRPTKTVRMVFSSSGELRNFEVFRSVIRSRRRFTYDEVLAILERRERRAPARSLPPDHEEYEEVLDRMAKLRDCLRESRYRRGALYLDIPKLRLVVDDEGEVVDLGCDARDVAHSLIEEFMLAANECVATYLGTKGLPLVARVHPPPDERKAADFRTFLKALGLRLGNPTDTRDLQRLVEQLEGDPLAGVIQLGLLRTMEHAEYVLGAGQHFALATASYCHFTSPIRRYPDCLVHQVLDEHLDGALGPPRRKEWEQRLPHVAEKASELERRAEEAEREMTRLRLIRHLMPRIGEMMEGRIVSVHPFGFFVRIDGVLIEGMVPVATLKDDYYEFDETRLALSGVESRRRFVVGQRVVVELHDLDADLREITFRFVESVEDGDERPKARGAARKKAKRKRKKG